MVMVAGGYPGTVVRDRPIHGLPVPEDARMVFFAGASRGPNSILTAGGRVLGVTARGNSGEEARRRAYEMVDLIDFETAAWRTDIGLTTPDGERKK